MKNKTRKAAAVAKSDIELARVLAQDAARTIRWEREGGKWFVFRQIGGASTQSMWKRSTKQDAAAAYSDLIEEAGVAAPRSFTRMYSLLEALQTQQAVQVDAREFDSDPFMLMTPKGALVINSKTGDYMTVDATPEMMLSRCTLGSVVDGATSGVDRLIDGMVKNDLAQDAEDVQREFLAAAMGCSLVGVASQMALVLGGHGANGKSTFLGGLMQAMGGYATMLKPDQLCGVLQLSDTPQPWLIRLRGVRMAAVTEMPDRIISHEAWKVLNGADSVSSRNLYSSDEVSFRLAAQLFVATNTNLRFDSGFDSAVARRTAVLELGRPRFVRDATMSQWVDTQEAADQFITKAVRCLHVAARMGWVLPPVGLLGERTVETSEADPVIAFLNERCTVNKDGHVLCSDLFDAFVEAGGGVDRRSFTMRVARQSVFGEVDRKRVRTEDGARPWAFCGLELR